MNEILYKLIHHKSYRMHFLNSDFVKINISKELIPDLLTIDKEQLIASSERVANKLLFGDHQGGRGLKSIFNDTLTAWELQNQRNCMELIFDFLESSEFEKYQEVPFTDSGSVICIEQAFYEFINLNHWNKSNPLEGLVRNEFLINTFKTLSTCKTPNFYLDPSFIKKNKNCFYSVQIYEYKLNGNTIEQIPHYILYASTKNKLISGEISALIADILYYENSNPIDKMGGLVKKYKVSINEYLNTCKKLKDMGILGND